MPGSSIAHSWGAVLDEAQASGLGLRRFAQSKGINPSTLSWWRWRLGRSVRARPSAPLTQFVEIEPATDVPVPVDGRLVVVVGAAHIPVDEATDLALLRRVLGALS